MAKAPKADKAPPKIAPVKQAKAAVAEQFAEADAKADANHPSGLSPKALEELQVGLSVRGY